METVLKRDVQREIIANEGRILLHDEVEEAPGRFTITAQWESVRVNDVMTPRDLFNMMVQEGYQVDYTRVAIVSSRLAVIHPLTALFFADRRASTTPCCSRPISATSDSSNG
jgi:hypothetical protein